MSSKDEHGLTPLQATIKETIKEHPNLDDKEIAEIVFDKRYPDEVYDGKDPSHTYVGKLRKRFAAQAKPPTFTVEEQDRFYPPPELLEEQEPETPFTDAFEPPEPEPEDATLEFEPIEGFNLDDTEFILTFTFDKFADWTGYDGWRFITDEQGNLIDPNEKRFASLTHRMMDKYMPDILDMYFLEFMFCYTGIMLIGGKTAGYMKYRRRNKPALPKPETPREEEPEPEPEQPTPETPEAPPEPEPLPYGAKAQGETEFQRRLRRQTP